MITVERVESREDFRSLEKEWSDLLTKSPDGDIFITHEWISLWVDHFGEGRDLRILVLRDGPRPVGIIPLVFERERWRRLPVRVLRFPLERTVGITRCGFILGERPEFLIRAFLEYLASSRGEWDVLHLEGLPSGSAHLDHLEGIAREVGFSVSPRYVAQVACYLQIDTDWAGYLRTKSSHYRQRLNQEWTRLQKFGEVSFSLHRDPAEVGEAMPRVLAILFARMGIRSVEEAEARDFRLIRFASDMTDRFSRKNSLEIRLMSIDDRPAACLLSVIRDRVVYTILTKYDPAFESASPGRAIFRYLLQDAANQGYREIDFLSSWSYLFRFTPTTREYTGLKIYNKGVYPNLMRIGKEYISPITGRMNRLLREAFRQTGEGPEEGPDVKDERSR